ncbi:MAG: prepilin peptidase [Nitrososphaeria archaeon]|nr:prepilin peptidase [Nitrososphaeria archaeon]
MTPLDAFRIIVISAGMIYASYRDWVSREVEDKVWIICGALGGTLTAADVLMRWNLNLVILSAFSIILASGLAFAFYYFGLYGGADAKAIATISISLPVYYSPRSLHPFTGLASLSNGLLLSLTLLLAMFLWNISGLVRGERIFKDFEHEGILRKIAAMFLGVRLKKARVKRFWFLMEGERDGKRMFDFNLFGLELKEANRDDCWMTPGIPLLIFITAGFLVYIGFGDFLYLIIGALS